MDKWSRVTRLQVQVSQLVTKRDALVAVVKMYMDGDQCVCENEGDGCIYDLAQEAIKEES